jgi:hypothetical protein
MCNAMQQMQCRRGLAISNSACETASRRLFLQHTLKRGHSSTTHTLLLTHRTSMQTAIVPTKRGRSCSERSARVQCGAAPGLCRAPRTHRDNLSHATLLRLMSVPAQSRCSVTCAMHVSNTCVEHNSTRRAQDVLEHTILSFSASRALALGNAASKTRVLHSRIPNPTTIRTLPCK